LNFSYLKMLNYPKIIPHIIPPSSQSKETRSSHPYVVLLGYYSDEWVDEPILGFLSIFSTEEKATTQFDYSQFLADNIHEQLFKFSTEGMFRYSSILVYLFLFFQADKFSFSQQKLDQDGNPQPVTSWTSIVRKNSSEFNFKQFIDQFYHPVVCMLSGRT
jgi:hypothetical protein